jgi:hypothetical protein
VPPGPLHELVAMLSPIAYAWFTSEFTCTISLLAAVMATLIAWRAAVTAVFAPDGAGSPSALRLASLRYSALMGN